MSKEIQTYLAALRKILTDNDPAIVQDALADAEEHLRTALAEQQAESPDTATDQLLPVIIEQYGTPEEIAQAYQTVETYTDPRPSVSAGDQGNLMARFFGVYGDPKAWGALLYMLISLVTGTLFFSWAVTGLAVSVSFALFIFGLPVAAFFLYSVRGLAVLEGRIVEALLGVRMPRRAAFAVKGADWKENLKLLFVDKRVWLMILYMIVMLPLGVFYFSLFVTLLALSVSFVIAPVASIFYDFPILVNGDVVRYLTPEYGLLMFFSGIMLLTGSMHLAKGLGFLQGKLAKGILVAE